MKDKTDLFNAYNTPGPHVAHRRARGDDEVPESEVRGQHTDGTGDGIILLDPTVKDSLDASGTGLAIVTGGAAVIVNSNNAEAARGTGGGGITANDFEITGGYTGSLNGTIHTGTTPVPDPLRYLPVPSVPANGIMTVTNLTQGNKHYVLSPGRYNNLPGFAEFGLLVKRYRELVQCPQFENRILVYAVKKLAKHDSVALQQLARDCFNRFAVDR